MGEFKGMINGVAYDDRAAFERAARDAGHRSGLGERTGDWRVGLPVSVRFKVDTHPLRAAEYGEPICGQVWAKGPERGGFVVLALDGGRWARAYPRTGMVEETGTLGTLLDKATGKVAA